jgi:nicotinamide-nucleotide amidase
MGLGESTVDQLAAELTSGSNPTVAPYAKPDGVYLRITAKAGSAGEAMAMIEPLEQELRKRLGSAVYGVDDETPATAVKTLLDSGGFHLGLLEIGQGAIGALSVPLSGYAGLGLIIASPSLQEAAKLLGAAGSELSLAQLSEDLLEQTGSGLVLALSVDQDTLTEDSVRARAEILLISGVAGKGTEAEPRQTAWATSSSEVRRLAGLAALNILRKWLLDNSRSEGSLKHAV